MSRNDENHLSRRDMAKMLGIHPSTLDTLRSRNQGPPFLRLGSRTIRYPVNSAKLWQEQNIQQ